MATLTAGKSAPDISLSLLNGGKVSLPDALQRGPVLAAFFKVSCPVCQYAFPYLERLHKAYGNQKITIVGISQDNPKDTAAFVKQYRVTFPIALDPLPNYEVSNAYGLTNVPSIFLIGQDGEIEISSVGWVKKDLENINRRLSEEQEVRTASLFSPREDVADFRAG